jgi:hypothetical protein
MGAHLVMGVDERSRQKKMLLYPRIFVVKTGGLVFVFV